MKNYLDLTLDAVFKTFFKQNKELCSDLLKQFIPPFQNKEIKLLSYLDSAITSERPKDKHSILDILVQVDQKELVNIEMQCIFKKNFNERALFYWSKLFTQQLKSGMSYEELCPTYSLLFTDHTLFKDLKSYYSSFSLRCDDHHDTIFSPYLKITVVELNKFKEDLEKLDKKGIWSYFIKNSANMTRQTLESISSRGEIMGVAVQKLKQMSKEESMQFLAEAREKARRDREAEIKGGIERGLEQGLEQGMQKGIQQGIKQGMQQGIQQGTQRTTHHLALKMIHKGIELSAISEITNLSTDELLKLKKEKIKTEK